MNFNTFISFKQYIMESKSSDKNYGCIMLYATIPDWNKLIERLVNEEDLYLAEDDEYGYEKKPHITLLWGIHDDEIIDKGIIFSKIKNISPIKVIVKEIGVFRGDESDNPYDVVKFNINPTKTLINLRKDLEEDLPNTQSYPNFEPHMTISYVKKGKGNKYRRILKKGLKFKLDIGVYSEPNHRKSYFDLKKTEYDK